MHMLENKQKMLKEIRLDRKSIANIQLRVSPSGRKLAGYSSDEEEEQVFKRVQCQHDPDFDLLQTYIEVDHKGEKVRWPNPYLYYWHWKETKEDVDEHIRESANQRKAHRRKLAEEMEKDPMKIPYFRTLENDTDVTDSSDSKEADFKDPLKHPPIKLQSSKVLEPATDHVIRRYPYMYRHLQGSHQKVYYQFKKLNQAFNRQMYALYVRIFGSDHCQCRTFTKRPLWYLAWKKCVRPIIKRKPRSWKFPSERKTETLFYGTMASIYETQYIPEYDLVPNMDDPVRMSQIALQQAMEIKKKFISYSKGVNNPRVDYISLQQSPMYEKYLQCIGLLCRYQPIKMSSRVRKVFFLNYFNVLSIQTQILRIPEVENMKYLWEIKGFWERSKGLAGYMELSLEEIYHGILRCNRVHPIKQVKVFLEDEHKGYPKEMSPTRLCLSWFDPRIHFAINTGCKASPPIQIFSLYEQDYQLDEVAKDYVRKNIKIDDTTRTVTLPILFLWYEKDFGNNQRVLLWYLKRFLLAKDVLKIRRLVTSNKTIRFKYERFNDELEPLVIKQGQLESHIVPHKKIIPLYWGNRF